MSQQRMDYDETNRQQQEPQPHFDNYESGYRDPFMGSYTGHKLSSQGAGSSNVSAGMRLALAIVSLGILIPIVGIIMGTTSSQGFAALIGGLIGLGVVCVTIMVVNIAFNYRR
ncbi:MAG TPA: hypothetical protein VK140_07250 [Ktedonobacteraceae bacterium]|nr:hypothetical protein [Ktedonobacteraceae bacterium]